MKLYSYWRSTTSFRVRAVLNLKGFEYEIESIDLSKDVQFSKKFDALNPSHGVPVLELKDGTLLTQSHAIICYLESIRPNPQLLSINPIQQAQEIAAALSIAMDIHPINNRRVLNYLRDPLQQPESEIVKYNQHWMYDGFMAFERKIHKETIYSFGDQIGLADIYLTSQMLNAHRWGMDLSKFDRLCEIDTLVRQNPSIEKALPQNQPDAD